MTFDAKAYLRELESERTRKLNGESRLPAVAGAFPVTKWQKAYATTTHGNQLRGFQRTCFDVCQRYSAGEAVERLKKLARGNEFYGLNEQDIEGLIEEQIACCEAARHPERRGVSDTGEPLDVGSDRGYQREGYFEERYERRGRISERAQEREEWQARGPREHEPEEAHKTDIDAGLGEWNAGLDADPPTPREWLLGNVFCRTFLSSLLGSGGVGKTALRYVQALSLATGRKLTGEHVFQRSRVLIVSLEDDDKELRRRIRAARLHHNITLSELDGWLFLAAPGAKAGKLMSTDRARRAIVGNLGANIEAAIVRHSIDLVMLDPFVKTHSVEENLNSAIDDVAQQLTDLATKHNIAIDTPHHVSKGVMAPGEASHGRGASSMIDAVRLVYTCLAMTADEAETFGIDEADRHSYIRIDGGKTNIVKHARNAKWFRLVSVTLDNATELYPSGDEVQTVEPWEPPKTWADLSDDDIDAVLMKIDNGLSDGNLYSDAPRAKTRAAWKVVQSVIPAKTEAQCREMIRTWVKNEMLVKTPYTNSQNRNPEHGLKLSPEKRKELDNRDLARRRMVETAVLA